VTPEEALAHPTWDMGPRITIDSATLFNKGLEVIEAHHLFDVDYDRISVLVHPQSILHSAVEFVDGSWKGHLGHPDMRIPIQYALTAPERAPSPARPFGLAGLDLTFEEPDQESFPAIGLAFAAGREGGSSPAVLNAADEVAVAAFLDGRLGFLGITEVVSATLETADWRPLETVEDVIAADRDGREIAASFIAGAC
jgi:1-deoxy-D-xylulose-5-phosphate reductoisomerase